jgi:hypothetical protein
MNSARQNAAAVLTGDVVEILRRAYVDVEMRDQALSAPKEVLTRHGIALPDDVELRLYERASIHGGHPYPKQDVAGDLMIETTLVRAKGIAGVSAGLDQWWRDTHMGCPFGTWPYITKQKVKICDAWVVAATGREWVSDIEGTQFGHWEYTDRDVVCVMEHDEEVEVIECLPQTVPTRVSTP